MKASVWKEGERGGAPAPLVNRAPGPVTNVISPPSDVSRTAAPRLAPLHVAPEHALRMHRVVQCQYSMTSSYLQPLRTRTWPRVIARLGAPGRSKPTTRTSAFRSRSLAQSRSTSSNNTILQPVPATVNSTAGSRGRRQRDTRTSRSGRRVSGRCPFARRDATPLVCDAAGVEPEVSGV